MSAPQQDYLRRIIFYFLTLNRTPRSATSVFKKMKHNADLCPRLRDQLETILGYFSRYRKLAYDMQGAKDSGTDVCLRNYVEDHTSYVCFQIKSCDDLKEESWLKTAKAQHFDTQSRFSPTDYYIVLGADAREDVEKIRLLEAEFSKSENTTIIEPSQFLFFLGLTTAQIGAITKTYIGDADVVVNNARNLLTQLYRPQLYLVFTLADLSARESFAPVSLDCILLNARLLETYANFEDGIRDEEEGSSSWVEYVYSSKDPRERILEDLEGMDEDVFHVDREAGLVTPAWRALSPLAALILDAQERYEYDEQDMCEYLESLLMGES